MRELLVRDSDGGRALLQLRWDGKTTRVTFVNSSIWADVESWMRRGVIEWVGSRGNKRQVVTYAHEPRFLDRVAAQLGRYGFFIQMWPPCAVDRALEFVKAR